MTAVLKVPATTQVKRSPVHVSPFQTRAKTMHDVTNEAKSAGTETQCALGPTARPKSALKREPISGNSGISQTSRDMSVVSRANPHHSKGKGSGCQGCDGPPPSRSRGSTKRKYISGIK